MLNEQATRDKTRAYRDHGWAHQSTETQSASVIKWLSAETNNVAQRLRGNRRRDPSGQTKRRAKN